jgi:hypothetical protein
LAIAANYREQPGWAALMDTNSGLSIDDNVAHSALGGQPPASRVPNPSGQDG